MMFAEVGELDEVRNYLDGRDYGCAVAGRKLAGQWHLQTVAVIRIT